MTEIENKQENEEIIMSYLYSEMTAKEIEEFEERIFLDDELFSEVVELENDLIDAYVSGNLTTTERKRFEQSLDKFPARREKIANANALQIFIKEEKEIAIPIAEVASTEIVETENLSLWQQISALFNIHTFAYGLSVLFVLVTVLSVLLFLDNRQKVEQLANLQDKKNGSQNASQQEIILIKGELAKEKENKLNLQQRVDKNGEAIGDLSEDLNKKAEYINLLEKKLAEVQNPNPNNPPDVTKTPQLREPPKVALIELTPTIPNKPDGNPIRTTRVGTQTTRVAINLSLPDATSKDERFSLILNEKPYLQNVAPRTTSEGKKAISLTIETGDLKKGKNKLSVINKDGKEVTNYVFEVNKQ